MTMPQYRHYGAIEAFALHKDLRMIICNRDTVKYVNLEILYYHYNPQMKSAEIPKHSDRIFSYISEYGRIQDA